MMNALETVSFNCPYCGEHIDSTVDMSAGNQSYIEDCSVCCRPVKLSVSRREAGDVELLVASENE